MPLNKARLPFARSGRAGRATLAWLREPLTPILHPSPWRLRILGLALAIGHPLFGWVWSVWVPQPYEPAWLRGALTLLALSLALPWLTNNLKKTRTQAIVSVIAWVELPLFFTWMYLSNGESVAWLASVSAMILIYYHLTDWRLATLGVLLAAATAGLLRYGLAADVSALQGDLRAIDLVVIGFTWVCAILLGLSSADLRRAQLQRTLQTMGIMAHELRTPLSTAALIGEAIEIEAKKQPSGIHADQLYKLADRLHALVRNMNHQIDTEIANARLLDLPHIVDLISAAALVADVVRTYPFAMTRQRECVRVSIQENFYFRSSHTQFAQVLDNLIKNALRSLMAADSRYAPAALKITVEKAGEHGRLVVSDDGMGIDAAALPHIFKPFYSSNQGAGHGLGLAFCQRVVGSAGGTIRAKSTFAVGASFIIDLPVSAAPGSEKTS